jgi:hypothetical protein
MVTLRSHYGIDVDFDKRCMFCGKYCVRNDNVSIVIKIKRINSGNISDICDKLNFTINYTHVQQLTHILSKHTQIL